MEYETFFTTFGGNGTIGTLVRFVTVHEFGHGYFMGLLASNEFEEPFLDEGMNELWDSRELANDRIVVRLPAGCQRIINFASALGLSFNGICT